MPVIEGSKRPGNQRVLGVFGDSEVERRQSKPRGPQQKNRAREANRSRMWKGGKKNCSCEAAVREAKKRY